VALTLAAATLHAATVPTLRIARIEPDTGICLKSEQSKKMLQRPAAPS